MTINATTKRPATMAAQLGVPWSTVLPLAAVMAYADGFWMVSLRGAVGSIERTQQPFTSWLRESTLALPLYVLGVLAALTLALRLFGPRPRTTKTLPASAALIIAAGTLTAVAQMAASSAYDYHLQSNQLQLMNSMGATCAGANCLPELKQASLALQVHAVGAGAAILLVTNLVLVGWVLALKGGRLNLATTRTRPATNRAHDLRLLLTAGLLGAAAIHAAVIPEHLAQWGPAGRVLHRPGRRRARHRRRPRARPPPTRGATRRRRSLHRPTGTLALLPHRRHPLRPRSRHPRTSRPRRPRRHRTRGHHPPDRPRPPPAQHPATTPTTHPSTHPLAHPAHHHRRHHHRPRRNPPALAEHPRKHHHPHNHTKHHHHIGWAGEDMNLTWDDSNPDHRRVEHSRVSDKASGTVRHAAHPLTCRPGSARRA